MLGFGLSKIFFGMATKTALAVGASLAPTSMGISLKVLQDAQVLSTPTGQLIIAAAVIDDVIALVLLSELEALEEPTAINFIVPVVASAAFILGVGFAAIRIVPGFLANVVVPRIPATAVEGSLLLMVLAAGYGIMAACYYGRSSHLLGAFLGGLCFCTLASVEHVWKSRVQHILGWLVRIFFACTIGFEVPIRDLWNGRVLGRTAVFLLVAFGKVATGAFAQPFELRAAKIIGFAMSAWGEFAFIVATASREAGTLDSDTYGAVVLAVLLSAIYSPFLTKAACDSEPGGARRKYLCCGPVIEGDGAGIEGTLNGRTLHRVYYSCSVQCRGSWGLTDNITSGLHREDSGVDLLDFRIHRSGNTSLVELALRDRSLMAPLGEDEPGASYVTAIEDRVARLDAMLREICGVAAPGEGKPNPAAGAEAGEAEAVGIDQDRGEVRVTRWRPALDEDDCTHDDDEAYRQAEELFAEAFRNQRDLPESAKRAVAAAAATAAAVAAHHSSEDEGKHWSNDSPLASPRGSASVRRISSSSRSMRSRFRRTDSMLNLEGNLTSSRDERLFEALTQARDEQRAKRRRDAEQTTDSLFSGSAAARRAMEMRIFGTALVPPGAGVGRRRRRPLKHTQSEHSSLTGRTRFEAAAREAVGSDGEGAAGDGLQSPTSPRSSDTSSLTLTGAGGKALAGELMQHLMKSRHLHPTHLPALDEHESGDDGEDPKGKGNAPPPRRPHGVAASEAIGTDDDSAADDGPSPRSSDTSSLTLTGAGGKALAGELMQHLMKSRHFHPADLPALDEDESGDDGQGRATPPRRAHEAP